MLFLSYLICCESDINKYYYSLDTFTRMKCVMCVSCCSDPVQRLNRSPWIWVQHLGPYFSFSPALARRTPHILGLNNGKFVLLLLKCSCQGWCVETSKLLRPHFLFYTSSILLQIPTPLPCCGFAVVSVHTHTRMCAMLVYWSWDKIKANTCK